MFEHKIILLSCLSKKAMAKSASELDKLSAEGWEIVSSTETGSVGMFVILRRSK
jgi:hypothetical protein